MDQMCHLALYECIFGAQGVAMIPSLQERLADKLGVVLGESTRVF